MWYGRNDDNDCSPTPRRKSSGNDSMTSGWCGAHSDDNMSAWDQDTGPSEALKSQGRKEMDRIEEKRQSVQRITKGQGVLKNFCDNLEKTKVTKKGIDPDVSFSSRAEEETFSEEEERCFILGYTYGRSSNPKGAFEAWKHYKKTRNEY